LRESLDATNYPINQLHLIFVSLLSYSSFKFSKKYLNYLWKIRCTKTTLH